MTRVYGGCIEPGGMDLEDSYETHPCPDCESPALHWRLERAEGSLNVYIGMRCTACGLERGDEPDQWSWAREPTRASRPSAGIPSAKTDGTLASSALRAFRPRAARRASRRPSGVVDGETG